MSWALLALVGCGSARAGRDANSQAGAANSQADAAASQAGATAQGGGAATSHDGQCINKPGGTKLIYPMGAVCAGDGTFAAVEASGCCASVTPAVADVSISLSGSGYVGALPPCEDQNAIDGLSSILRVEGSEVAPYSGLTKTVINGVRTDVSPSCGQSVIIASLKEHVQIANGTVLQITQRNVPYDSSTLDISRITTVVADRDGSPLLIVGLSAAPPDIDTKLLPAIGLSVEQAPVCRWAPSYGSLLRVHVTAGDADCALDAGTRRCCTMFGETMEAEIPAATRTTDRYPTVLVNVTLHRVGLFVPDP